MNLSVQTKVATCIAVYANWGFARIEGIGWGWAMIIWLFTIITYVPLDILKFIIRYGMSGKAWDNLLQNKVRCFETKLQNNIIPYSFFLSFCSLCLYVCNIDCLHNKERLWKGRERGTMGLSSTHTTWPPATRASRLVQWQQQLPRVVWDCGASQKTGGNRKVLILTSPNSWG